MIVRVIYVEPNLITVLGMGVLLNVRLHFPLNALCVALRIDKFSLKERLRSSRCEVRSRRNNPCLRLRIFIIEIWQDRLQDAVHEILDFGLAADSKLPSALEMYGDTVKGLKHLRDRTNLRLPTSS